MGPNQHCPETQAKLNVVGQFVRADSHLDLRGRKREFIPLLPEESEVLRALLIPGHLGKLPPNADALNASRIVDAAVATGLVLAVRDNAAEAGLDAIAKASRLASQRQLFIGRERWRVDRLAAKEISRTVNMEPLAMGAVAMTHLAYARPESRLHREVGFLVPEGLANSARRAVRRLAGVNIRARLFPGRARRHCEAALWSRSSPLLKEGWQLPTSEDLAVLTSREFGASSGARRLTLLVDLFILTKQPAFHWPSFVKRAIDWRMQVPSYQALGELKVQFRAKVPLRVMTRLEPTFWNRFVYSLFGA